MRPKRSVYRYSIWARGTLVQCHGRHGGAQAGRGKRKMWTFVSLRRSETGRGLERHCRMGMLCYPLFSANANPDSHKRAAGQNRKQPSEKAQETGTAYVPRDLVAMRCSVDVLRPTVARSFLNRPLQFYDGLLEEGYLKRRREGSATVQELASAGHYCVIYPGIFQTGGGALRAVLRPCQEPAIAPHDAGPGASSGASLSCSAPLAAYFKKAMHVPGGSSQFLQDGSICKAPRRGFCILSPVSLR